jgi:PAS domain S-box-containing protein
MTEAAAGRPLPQGPQAEALLHAMLAATIDAFVAIDGDGRVTLFSPSAERLFGFASEEAVGRPLGELIVPPAFRPFHERGLERHRTTGGSRLIGRRTRLAAMRRDGTQFPVELTIFEVPRVGPTVYAAFLHDATKEASVEQALVESGQHFAEQARVLQRSLLSVPTARIPGLDVAAVSVAGEEDMEVGGDFCDVFALQRGACAIVVGDVEGKGLESAAAMVLARFTVRGAAQRRSRPRAVVRALNEAIFAQDSPRLCTLAYARVTRASRGYRLTMGLAGHPQPLVCGAAGVRAAGRPGVALGVVRDPKIPERTIELGPGDVAVFYSDGLTESRSPTGDFLGERPVRELLDRNRDRDAETIARTLVALATRFQGGRVTDDTTVVVVKVPEGDP